MAAATGIARRSATTAPSTMMESMMPTSASGRWTPAMPAKPAAAIIAADAAGPHPGGGPPELARKRADCHQGKEVTEPADRMGKAAHEVMRVCSRAGMRERERGNENEGQGESSAAHGNLID